MHTQSVAPSVGPEPYSLSCMEVWGGNQSVARPVALPGLDCWVYSDAYAGASGGGDVYYLSVCAGGLLSRIALADVSGHGIGVDSVAKKLLALMRNHINTWDQTEFVAELDTALRDDSSSSHYATGVVVGYHRDNRQLVFTLAGHPAPLRLHFSRGEWSFLKDVASPAGSLSGLPLGLIEGTTFQQNVISFQPGDTLVLYSDGLNEAENEREEQFGQEALLETADRVGSGSAARLGQALVSEIDAFSHGSQANDDRTLIVIHSNLV